MHKNIIPLLALALSSIWACQDAPKPAATTALPSIDSLFAEYHRERLPLFPIEATFAGDPRYNDVFPNTISQAHRSTLRAFYTKYKTQLEAYDRTQLTDNQRISRDILHWECDINLADLSFPTELLPINQFDCPPLMMGQLASGASGQPFKTVQDYDHWLRRVDGFVIWCDTAMANMRRGMATGYVLPKTLAEKMVPQWAAFSTGPVEKHQYYSPIALMPQDFPAAEKERLTQAYQKMVSEKIIPVYQRMHQFIKAEYLPACRASSGISAIPNGEKYYAHQIRTYTTTNMNAEEIFKLGEQEVARLLSEMEKVKTQVGYTGDLKSFFNHVRQRKELMPFTKPEQVIENFNQIHEAMKPQLAKLFDLVPKTPFVVKRTESFREKTASAEYVQGSLDGTRPGTFYVPIPNVREYNMYSDEDLFLHEAIPGHHYQISLQQENQLLPDFRRTLWYSAYGEGWALYCESLGTELGLYKDPYQYFGMLSAEMHRAIRLVVDAGIHTKSWTREQAIQYSLDHEAESEASIVSEIERYMSWPGQALSYKVGQLKIRELRARAEKALGQKFDIRTFHKIVLEDGCLPLTVLESKVDSWVKSAR